MKIPRVHDFDPDAKIPELGSPLDNMPAIQKPQAAGKRPFPQHESKHEQQNKVDPVLPVRDVRPTKRIMKPRHPFDIYQDQYEALKDFAAEERKQGGAGSMSAMVRKALDNFISDKKRVG